MKKITAIILIVLLSIAIKLYFFPAKRIINYTALGDSIAEGYSASENHGYTYMINEYFENSYKTVYYRNCAKSGDLSIDLLNKLKFADEVRESVKNADIITVSIGGNDLLSGIDDLKNGDLLSLDKRIKTFFINWEEILKTIKQLNSDAEIYIMNLYNPVNVGDNYQGLFCSREIFRIIESYIMSLNNTITDDELMSSFDYNVIDIYSVFKNYSSQGVELTNFKTNSDPHPNDKGHEIIFKEHSGKFIKMP